MNVLSWWRACTKALCNLHGWNQPLLLLLLANGTRTRSRGREWVITPIYLSMGVDAVLSHIKQVAVAQDCRY